MRAIKIILLFLFSAQIWAATYYVRTDGNDGNAGTANTAGGAWLTMTYAAAHHAAGDTIRVQPGLYNERVALSTTGTSGAGIINWVADGAVICRGFDTTSINYTRIIGFEITHTDTSYARGIAIGGTSAHVELWDNYIHNNNQVGIGTTSGSAVSYLTARGNRLEEVGIVSGVVSNATSAISPSATNNSFWLLEYNTVKRSGDFIDLSGVSHIVRNNYLHDMANSYWGTDNSFHSDMFQAGSDGSQQWVRNHIYERNFCGDSIEVNSHGGLHQDTTFSGDTNIIYRGNVFFNFGSGGIGVIGVGKVSTYNNIFYKTCQGVNGSVIIFYKGGSTDTYYSYGNLVANTLVYDFGLSSDALVLGNGVDSSTATFTHNMGWLAGTEPSYVPTTSGADPLFVNAGLQNFRLQVSSPARAAGLASVTITTGSGSGTSFAVNDGQLLSDGWGLVDGDTVTINATTTKITAISGNTVTVANSVSWTVGDAVHWGSSTAEDIGAYPYGAVELTAATISSVGTTYTVTPVGDARGVWFYVDGIPTTWVSAAPYAATIASGVVTAKAYALYAQAGPVVTATAGAVPSLSRQAGGVRMNGGVKVR